MGHLLSHAEYNSLTKTGRGGWVSFGWVAGDSALRQRLLQFNHARLCCFPVNQANLTDDNECWIAIDHLLTESKNHATLVALDVAVKGEDRTWQCGYAQALGDIHRTLDKRRKGETR